MSMVLMVGYDEVLIFDGVGDDWFDC